MAVRPSAGSATIPLRDRLSFGATIGIDTFNLDSYLPEGDKTSRVAEEHDQTDPNSSPTGPLAFLNDFDANVVFRAGSLRFRGVDLEDVYFNGSLLRGRLQINQAGVRGLAGASAGIKGTLSKLEQVVPEFTGTVVASAENTKELFDFLRLESPIPPERLGPLRLNGKTEATSDGLSFEGRLQYAEVRGDLKGRVSNLSDSPEFRFDLEGQHPDLARLAALFVDDIEAPEGLRPVGSRLTVKARGRGRRQYTVCQYETGYVKGTVDPERLRCLAPGDPGVGGDAEAFRFRQLGEATLSRIRPGGTPTWRFRSCGGSESRFRYSPNPILENQDRGDGSLGEPDLAKTRRSAGPRPGPERWHGSRGQLPGHGTGQGNSTAKGAASPLADWSWLFSLGRAADLDLDLRVGCADLRRNAHRQGQGRCRT